MRYKERQYSGLGTKADGTEPVTINLTADKTLTLSNGLQVLAGQSLIIDGEGSLIATATDNTGNP